MSEQDAPQIESDMIELSCFLKFDESKVVQMYQKGDGFQLKPNERAIKVVLEVPRSAFEVPKVPTLRLRVDESAIVTRLTSAD